MTRPSFVSCLTSSATEGALGTRSPSLEHSSSSPKGEANSGKVDSLISGEGGGRVRDAARESGARCQQSVRRVSSFSSSMETEGSRWPSGLRGPAIGRWTVSALFVVFGLLLLGSCTVTASAVETVGECLFFLFVVFFWAFFLFFFLGCFSFCVLGTGVYFCW